MSARPQIGRYVCMPVGMGALHNLRGAFMHSKAVVLTPPIRRGGVSGMYRGGGWQWQWDNIYSIVAVYRSVVSVYCHSASPDLTKDAN